MVSQPAVSKQIRQLERRLGTPLFDRLPKGVRLTEAGLRSSPEFESWLRDSDNQAAWSQVARAWNYFDDVCDNVRCNHGLMKLGRFFWYVF